MIAATDTLWKFRWTSKFESKWKRALTTFPMAQSVRWNFPAFICTLSFLEMNASWLLPPMALTSDGVTPWTRSRTPPRVLPEWCCADTHRTCHNGRDPHGTRAPALTGRWRHVVGIHICLSSRSHLFRISTPHTNPCKECSVVPRQSSLNHSVMWHDWSLSLNSSFLGGCGQAWLAVEQHIILVSLRRPHSECRSDTTNLSWMIHRTWEHLSPAVSDISLD